LILKQFVKNRDDCQRRSLASQIRRNKYIGNKRKCTSSMIASPDKGKQWAIWFYYVLFLKWLKQLAHTVINI